MVQLRRGAAYSLRNLAFSFADGGWLLQVISRTDLLANGEEYVAGPTLVNALAATTHRLAPGDLITTASQAGWRFEAEPRR